MSEQNEAAVRRLLESLGARPEDAPAIVRASWDPDGDYYPVRKFPESRSCHGREAVARFFAEYVEAWSYRHTVNSSIGVSVLVHTTLHAEGRRSEMSLEGDIYHSV